MKALLIITGILIGSTVKAGDMSCSDLKPLDMVKRFCITELKSTFEDMDYNLIRENSWGFKIDPSDRKWANQSHENTDRMVKTATYLLTLHNKKCNPKAPYTSAAGEACRIVKRIKSIVNSMMVAEKHDSKMKNPEYKESILAGKICVPFIEYEHYKNAIKKEHEKAKISGFVNATKLKRWGDRAYAEKADADRAIASYKKEYSKDFDLERCRK